MTYIEHALKALLAALGDTEQDWNDDRTLLLLYVLLVLTKGEDCTSEDVHDAWAVARQWTRPGHPDLVPFGDLTPEVQSYDVKYRDAIRVAALALPAKDGAR